MRVAISIGWGSVTQINVADSPVIALVSGSDMIAPLLLSPVRRMRLDIAAYALLASAGCAGGSSAQNPDSCGAPAEPIELFPIPESPSVLGFGAITGFADDLIVAGNVIPADTLDESEFTTGSPLVFSRALGTLPNPPGPRQVAPVAISLAPGRWGLLWGVAAPRDWFEGEWPVYRINELWFSEWLGNAWSAPHRLASSNVDINWLRDRTTLHTPETGPLVMVSTEEHVGETYLLFGSPLEELRPFPLPDSAQPYASTFTVDESGKIVAFVHVLRSRLDGTQITEIISVTSDDAGRTWTQYIAPLRTTAGVDRPSVHIDAQGVRHLVWAEGFSRIRHAYYDAATAAWQGNVLLDQPGAGQSGTVSGVDRCGILGVFHQAFTASGEANLGYARWIDGRWHRSSIMNDFAGISPIRGVGHGRQWAVGWTGLRKSKADEDHLSFWFFVP